MIDADVVILRRSNATKTMPSIRQMNPAKPIKPGHVKYVKRIKFWGGVLLVLCIAVGMRLSSDAEENTPLAKAVERGDVKAATALLQSGADPNRPYVVPGKALRPPFWDNVAFQFPWLKSTATSFDYSRRESLLWLTVERNQPEMARLLLQHGANPNLAGNDRDTPLLDAAEEGDASMVNLFLTAGANVNQTGKDGATALFLTVIGEALYRGVPIGSQHQPGDYHETLRLLIASGADVNTSMGWGSNDTPLQYARKYKRDTVAALLVKAGAR